MQGLPGRHLRRHQEVRQGASICLEPQAAPRGSQYPNSLVLTGLSSNILSNSQLTQNEQHRQGMPTSVLSKTAPSFRCSARVGRAVSAGLQLRALTHSTRQSWELNTIGRSEERRVGKECR